MACLWLRGLPAQPLPPRFLGLRPQSLTWSYMCVLGEGGAGAGGSVPRKDVLSCSWEGSPRGFLVLPIPLLARIQGQQSHMLGGPHTQGHFPALTTAIKCYLPLRHSPHPVPEVMSVCDVFLCFPHSIPPASCFHAQNIIVPGHLFPQTSLFLSVENSA